MKKEFQIPSDLGEVHKASADILAFLEPAQLDEDQAFDVRLCLEEALINAMKYGNRLERERNVNVGVEVGDGELRLRVEDQGEGFDVKNVKDCTREENRERGSGRGIYLMHHLMDRVEYSPKGNSLTMVKKLKKGGIVR